MRLKQTKRPNPHARKIVITIRVNSEELRELFKNCHSATGGNLSEYLRMAGLKWKPKKEGFQKWRI